MYVILRERRAFLALTLLILLAAPLQLTAQTQTGQLIGTVTQDGNPLPGVRVTVSSPALQGTRSTETDVNGSYNILRKRSSDPSQLGRGVVGTAVSPRRLAV